MIGEMSVVFSMLQFASLLEGGLLGGATVALGIGILMVVVIMIIQSFRQICFPNDLLVFTGRQYTLPDGRKSNIKVLFGGGGWRLPFIEKVFRMNMTVIPIEVQVKNAYSKGNIPLMVQAIANVKISNDPRIVGNAIERFLGKPVREVQRVAKETLEANLRNILATLTPEQVNEDRLKFAQAISDEVEEDLEKLGMMLDTLKIQHVSDESQYLESIGRKKIAEVIKNAKIAESDANRESETYTANAMANARVAEEEAEKSIRQTMNRYEALKAELESRVKAVQNEILAAAQEARADAEQELQQKRQQQEQLRLQAEVVLPSLAQKQAQELEAEAEAAPILENGKALASSLHMLSEQWVRAGADAKNIYLIQQLEQLTETIVHSIKHMDIREVELIDNGDGRALPQYVAGFPNTVTAVLQSIREAIGVDVPHLLQQQSEDA